MEAIIRTKNFVNFISYATPLAVCSLLFLAIFRGSHSTRKNIDFDGRRKYPSGGWIRDSDNYPLYSPHSCPFVEKNFDCLAKYKPFREYETYGWRTPEGLNFNATEFLSNFQNRNLLFAGDSFMRQMYQSILCLLTVGPGSTSLTSCRESENRTTYLAANLTHVFSHYNATLTFISSRFLVDYHENCTEINGSDALTVDPSRQSCVFVDRPDDRWLSRASMASSIVLHTGSWWSDHLMHRKGIRMYQQRENGTLQALSPHKALKIAIRAVSTAVDAPPLSETPVFLLGMTVFHYFKPTATKKLISRSTGSRKSNPFHYYYDVESVEWNRKGDCSWVDTTITNDDLLPPRDERVAIVEDGFAESRRKFVLRIAKRLRTRADAHVGLREDRIMDCSHYCIPGVPDSWNEMLFERMMQSKVSP